MSTSTARSHPLGASISFTTERFDYRSDVPGDSNAGNRFYGQDVAEFLVEHLRSSGLPADCVDEDWGWLVFSVKGQSPIFQVAVYNLAEYRGVTERGIGEWGLWIRAYERRKVGGVVPTRHEVPVPAAILGAIESAIRAAGAVPETWEDGPSDA